MLVREFIEGDFDTCFNYVIFDCREKGVCWEEAPILFSTVRPGEGKYKYLTEEILNMRIAYITTAGRGVMIEAE